MKLLVINGPNINFLGIREKSVYGNQDYDYLLDMIEGKAQETGCQITVFQSNHEFCGSDSGRGGSGRSGPGAGWTGFAGAGIYGSDFHSGKAALTIGSESCLGPERSVTI